MTPWATECAGSSWLEDCPRKSASRGDGALRLSAIAAIALAGLYIYSYVIWREDHGAVPPAGRQPAEES